MDLRRYELATLAAAMRLRSSYCALAHGKELAERFDARMWFAPRCFLSTVLDATGAEPDVIFRQLDPRIRDSLTVGHDIAREPG
jgi:hypothetical protein